MTFAPESGDGQKRLSVQREAMLRFWIFLASKLSYVDMQACFRRLRLWRGSPCEAIQNERSTADLTLKLGGLTFRLPIQPRRNDRVVDGSSVLLNPVDKGGDEACLGGFEPGVQVGNSV